jgi:hypothetical protein
LADSQYKVFVTGSTIGSLSLGNPWNYYQRRRINRPGKWNNYPSNSCLEMALVIQLTIRLLSGSRFLFRQMRFPTINLPRCDYLVYDFCFIYIQIIVTA